MEPDLLEQAEFADNPEPRCPVVLVLDTSGSMAGDKIRELNAGLVDFSDALKKDRLASLRVEVAVVTFGGRVRALDVRGGERSPGKDIIPYSPNDQATSRVFQEIPFDAHLAFVTVDEFQPPMMVASGETPMGEAIQRSLALLRDRKEIYKQNGLDYFRWKTDR